MKTKQGKIEIKGNKVNPVILEIDETQSKMNSQLISRMSKKDASQIQSGGGFKRTTTSKPLYRPQNQSALITNEQISSRIGINKHEPVYVGGNQPQQVTSISNINNRIDGLVKHRAQRNANLLGDYHTIANQKERFQEAYHAKSSLDVINLQNIESKLEAHRRMMRPVQDEYHHRKGKTVAPDRYGFLKTNINVDEEYEKYSVGKKHQNDQIYQLSELARKRQDVSPQRLQFDELWQLKKKNNPKLAQYDAEYQQYLLQKDAKNIINHTINNKLYKWDNFTQPQHKKSKSKIKSKVHKSDKKQHSLEKRTPEKQEQQEMQKYGHDGLMSIKDVNDAVTTKDDKLIASYIFAQIDKQKIGWISKQQLHEYILSQTHIINGYQIDTKWLYTDLDNFETKRKGMISRAELGVFLATLNRVEHPQLILSKKKKFQFHSENKNTSCSFKRYKEYFEKLFDSLDFNDDKIIKRQEYIENIYSDADCIKLLEKEAVYIQPVQKSITYRQIIECILNEYRKEKNQKLKKSKQFITFHKFCEYFQVPQYLNLRNIDKNKTKKHQTSQSTIFDIPSEYLILLKDIYNSLPRIYQEYIVSMDFIQTSLRDPQICALSDELCRIQSIQTSLPLQTIFSTLHRMQKQCDQYSTWEQLKLFFSRRGRPLDWDYELIKKKKELRNKQMKNKRSQIKELQFSDLAQKLKDRRKSKVNVSGINKYTVPQPFDITDMKNQDNERQINEGKEQFQKYQKQFKAKPVNMQILQSKPDLIEGKLKKKEKSSEKEKYMYKYENYENDRIQRALKKAQEKYEDQQRIKMLKEQRQIKAMNIGVDLTKKYQDVIKEQKKKKEKQMSKNKTTKPKVSENLYPSNIKDEKAKKIDKIKQKMEKEEEAARRKNEQQERNQNDTRQKNKQKQKITQESIKNQKQQDKKRQQIRKNEQDFKPKIKKKQLSQAEKEAIQKGKQERQRKKKQQEQKMLIIQEQRRKKILAQQNKVKTINVNEYNDEQILERIDEVDFEDLLLDPESKTLYKKEFDDKNKTRKELKDREHGLAGRERAAMDEEEKRIGQEKKKYKIKKQQEHVDGRKQGFSATSEKGQKSHNNELQFHRSKALRRYRALMQGKQPLSQFDKYSVNKQQI